MKFSKITAALLTAVSLNAFTLPDVSLEKLKDKSTSYIQETKEAINESYTNYITKKDEQQPKPTLNIKQKEVIWEDIIEDLNDGAKLVQKQNQAKSSSWFSSDKEDIQEDINIILDKIIQALTKNSIMEFRNLISQTQNQIEQTKQEIIQAREDKVSAPIKSHLTKTKKDYTNLISEKKQEIKALENYIVQIRVELKESFKKIGVDLTQQQVDSLINRVDGDNILEMTYVMDILQDVTAQILTLMKDSGEELSQAKKYYGMHAVCLNIVYYIQGKYIDQTNSKYIPKIEEIMEKASHNIEQTSDLLKAENQKSRKSIYEKNLNAQKLTLKVAKLYKKDLKASIKRMRKARELSLKNLEVAKNTFATVSLSSELYDLISESQNLYNGVMKIQMPEIVPFENKKIEEKYNELSKLIK